MYSEKLLEEFYNPANVGVIKGANAVSKVKDKACGDIVKFYADVKNKTVVDVKFQTYGNIVAIAASSLATKLMMGKSFDEIATITAEQLKSELGGNIPSEKLFSINLVEDAIHSLIVSYFKKTQGSVPEEYKFSPIMNSDEIAGAEEEEEEEVKPAKAPKAKKEVKKVEISDDDLDEDDLDEEDEEEAEVKEEVKVAAPAKENATTKSVKRTVQVYTSDNPQDLEEKDIFGSIDEITSSLSDAIKKLNDGSDKQ
ncbi:MAG: iron-sulfur cluster assembly scaffold protein [bacterium]|nr:iron-sulfur cluster assembly scaffold protein [bacterium]